ncbi:MAG TPA: malonic semialdehyde reductase [Alphaproteobacteria bacterium]|nr:malonic semialdehyde reductase [Alphaproteobacteria bacterium]
MTAALSEEALDLLFRKARTHNVWLPKPVPDELLRRVYDLAKWGPTSANSSPMRVVFVKSEAARAKLLPALIPGNAAKTKAAPVCAIVAYDSQFYELVPRLFPHQLDAITWFKGPGKERAAESTAFRNGSLQGAYLMIAARALGLDCGPMSGFDNVKVDAAFFPDGRYKSNFLCNLGYGDASQLFPRGPRLAFEEACAIV